MINLNSAYEEEIYFNYLRDPDSVSPDWKKYFDKKSGAEISKDFSPAKNYLNNGFSSNGHAEQHSEHIEGKLEPLSSIQAKIAENMNLSLEIPSATSVRNIPVKALDENRRIINRYLKKLKRKTVSFTQILAWAVVKSLIKYPKMNDSYIVEDGKPYRVKKESINMGFAVDITKKDGTRMLMVPNVKNAQNMNFSQFIEEFEKIIDKTRNNKLELSDMDGTTITLTNPGMIGTTASSPRLMSGQGLIVATGSIDYPVEFQAVRPEILTKMAISKTVTITSTYDHRITQGAESAEFLAYLHKLLIGDEHFYDQIFVSLQIPFEPIKWQIDNSAINRYGDSDEHDSIEKAAHVALLINAFRVRGHLLASVNPLGLSAYNYPELDPAFYGFTIWDLDRIFHADDTWAQNNMPLRDIIELLRESYCGNISVEFMHIQDPEKKDWVKRNVERTRFTYEFTKEEKYRILRKLIEAEEFENFLHTKYVGHKRFSLEGSESVIVMLEKIYEQAADDKMNSVVLGMSHRGRLNVLVNITGKSVEKIFNEFEGEADPDSYMGSGDVKYHLGDKGIYTSYNGNTINSILAPNPSHLELIDPIIEGMAKAINHDINDNTDSRNLPVLVHGDAAFAGQGIVAETLNFSQLEGYKTGGTIHIIVNNQIGFTTNAQDARSTVYATDIAKMIQCPIVHVNGNEPESVAGAAIFAYNYRNKFGSDIIIDMLCYRKYGHNESDEPAYTQPLLYKKIKSIRPVGMIYRDELIIEKNLTEELATSYVRETQEKLYNAFINRTVNNLKKSNGNGKARKTDYVFNSVETAVPEDKIRLITDKITKYPSDFKANPKIIQLLKKRSEMVASNKAEIDWAMAEALAFGSILNDGKDIRFSGQDSRRGTFSQRHAVLTDMETEDQYIPLNNIKENQNEIRIYDSPLSELSIVGFEYGYSVLAKNSLVLWEAQFGDFANMAQAMIDQIIVCAESKWNQTSNLVLLLPHSYDGQGPEHSSGRFERYLQLAAENNIIVGNFTTPANYFHALRRQAFMPNKKPMIIMTPKGMLRHPMAVSSIQDLSSGGFQYIIDDPKIKELGSRNLEMGSGNRDQGTGNSNDEQVENTNPQSPIPNPQSPIPSPTLNLEDIKKVVFCTGKLFYEVLAEREKRKITDTAIIRIEQLYPLNLEQLKEILGKYKNAENIIWFQEEPRNMGAWSFISSQFIWNLDVKLKYVGRKESASTATGSNVQHIKEQQGIIEEVLG